MSLPPDPDNMNDQRSDWAGAAVAMFVQRTRTDQEDALSDLLGDLMHWADRHGFDFDNELDRARTYYGDETQTA
jgi:hypothetical protein